MGKLFYLTGFTYRSPMITNHVPLHSAKIENAILCNNVRIGEKAQIKDCELGAEFEVEVGADLKGERLTAGEEA